MNRAGITIFFFIILAFPGALLLAHDLWLEQGDQGYVLHQGHRHSGHGGEAVVPCGPGMVRDVRCVDVAGATRDTDAVNAYPVRIPGPCAAVHVIALCGYSNSSQSDPYRPPNSQSNHSS